MTKILSLVMLLVASGCAALLDSVEAPTALYEKSQQSSKGAMDAINALENASDADRSQSTAVAATAEEIRQVQMLLKTAGFYPGRVDGAFDPKTKIALAQFRTSCSALNDLLRGADLEKLAPAIESSGANRNNAARTMLRKEEIRVIQVRLKDAGFDPGTVDGISGPNTRAAVTRFRSGCGAVKNMLPAVLEAARSTESDNISGATTARGDIMSVALPGGGAESSEAGSLTSAATKDSSPGRTRRLH